VPGFHRSDDPGRVCTPVLDNLDAAAGGIVDDWDMDPDGSTPGTKIAAQAEDANGGSGFGKGSAGTISLFKAFHDPRTTS
jgi:hypothetical protein